MVVVISGCTSGIGARLSALYKARGDEVFELSRTASGENCYSVDVSDADAVAHCIDDILAKRKVIDTVIANAGYGLSGAIELLPNEEIKRQTDVNFHGALNLVRACLKGMTRGGKAVIISSACALFTLPYRAIYCASKAAVTVAAYGLYMECKDFGIKVSCICPGDIRTNFSANRVKIGGGDRYGDAPDKASAKIDNREHKRMNADKATKKIFKCAVKCKKPLYIVGAKYKVLFFLKRLLPTKTYLNLTKRIFG